MSPHDLYGALTALWDALTHHWVAVFVLLVMLTVIMGTRTR